MGRTLLIQYREYLDDQSTLNLKKVTDLELRKKRIALTVLSSIPELDRFTALEL